MDEDRNQDWVRVRSEGLVAFIDSLARVIARVEPPNLFLRNLEIVVESHVESDPLMTDRDARTLERYFRILADAVHRRVDWNTLPEPPPSES